MLRVDYAAVDGCLCVGARGLKFVGRWSLKFVGAWGLTGFLWGCPGVGDRLQVLPIGIRSSF
ncbi:hypothetical protein BTA35_0208200 [Oceanospirillum linum]|uniref:Uncharacterized protein n=1 Tax=Oceanospirillum linum TaxID=966 RepID=A0A1T1HB00_OCELI|nr:hypothetical protein BTA35_0208200 [Oceanospirillum linum]